MAKTLTDEEKVAMREASRGTAHALSDDLKYLREILRKDGFTEGDLRRTSSQLRRILIENDLRDVAAPRVGRIRIQAPQLRPYYQANERQPLALVVGGKLSFKHAEIGNFATGPRVREVATSPDDTIPLSVEDFVRQRVICCGGRWVTRHTIIKYVAIVAHGVHSENPRKDPEYEFLAKIKNYAAIMFENGVPYLAVCTDALRPNPQGFKLERGEIDLALLQLMSTTEYLVNSPEVIELEKLIDAEPS